MNEVMTVLEDCREVPVRVADEVELPTGYGGVTVDRAEAFDENAVRDVIGDVTINLVRDELLMR